jgi:adenylate cyclase
MSHNGSRGAESGRYCLLSCSTFLSLVISASFLLAFIIVSVPLYLAVQEGHRGVGLELQKHAASSVQRQLENSVTASVEQVAALVDLLSLESSADSSLLSPTSERLRDLLFSSTRVAHAGVLAGFPDGRAMGYLGAISHSVLFINASGTLRSFNTDRRGIPGSANSTLTDFDVRRERWYTGAAQQDASSWTASEQLTWSAIETHPGLHCLGVTASRPVRVEGKVVAVIAVHLPLAMVTDVLNSTETGLAREVFVFNRERIVVGMSNRSRVQSACNVTMNANAQDEQVFRHLVAQLLSFGNGTFGSIPAIEARILKLAGLQFLLTTYVLERGDLRWTWAMIVPRTDFFTTPDKYFRNSLIAAGLIVVLLSIAMMRFTSVLYTHPLLYLADAMDDVATHLQTADFEDSGSIIHEVRAIEYSYKRMAAALQGVTKYVPLPVVQQLMRDAGNPETFVYSRECTFLFADIVGFTTLSETVPPRQLHAQLTEFFAVVEEVLTELRGIATDLLGDGFFVFWNAPHEEIEHAQLACEAALRLEQRLKVLQGDWAARGLLQLRLRIGINTGQCLVGSFGSHHHLKYTAMGDAVNVASRLEQLNKHYLTNIIIGDTTLARVSSSFLARPLDVVVLLGKTAKTRVYSLMCRRDEASDAQLFLAEQSEMLLEAFDDRSYDKVQEGAQSILNHFPNDEPTKLLLARCSTMGGRASPRIVLTK